MLKQFVAVMPGVLGPALVIMSLSVVFAVGEGRRRPRSHAWRLWGLALGLVAAVVFAALRATAVVNQRTFINYPVLVALVVIDSLVIVLVAASTRIVSGWPSRHQLVDLANALSAVMIALTIFFAVPDVILELTIWVEPGDPVFTSDMLLRASGFVLGVGLSVVVAAIFRTMRSTPKVRPWFVGAACILVVIVWMQHLTALLQIVQARDPAFPMRLFVLLAWSINHNDWFIMAQALVFLLPVGFSLLMGIRHPHDDGCDAVSGAVAVGSAGPEVGNARARVARARRRHARVSALWSICAMVMVVLTMTVGVARSTEVITLSPPEKYSLSQGVATITFAQVADGHLHRFQYTAKDGTVMRFIIIKKNGGAYGVGLDACENCGDAGYYEKDGKIICKRCEVAINLATIGFKGGCNPIPFDYTTQNGKIVIQTSVLDALSSHFQ
ncbi:DUF2318 domain-containing protein [uncultured Bifidobacterium sp.]|uniref:DUF2318 domain-containing protein n=1 Tax=uncultured Bifidobacterium sp. TaxID=165187 RepID=UPI002609DCE4|nr:DUF2318 domain-containing protein [uncultured Bifidobacterium sp.]